MITKKILSRLIQEPIVQFFFVGTVLFCLYYLFQPTTQNTKVITINQSIINHLKATNTQRDDFIRDEALYREALALGLDQNDFVIKRRLIQKLSFLIEDLNTDGIQSTEKEILDYYQKNKDAYRTDENISFEQIYFSSDKHGENTKRVAAKALSKINSDGQSVDSLRKQADRTSLKPFYAELTPRGVMFTFGKKFSNTIFTLEKNSKWQGPFESGFGFHLVKITSKKPSMDPKFERIKDNVEKNYIYEELKKRNRHAIDRIVRQYQIKQEVSS